MATKKTFVAVAEIMSQYSEEDSFSKAEVVRLFASIFADENPRFDFDKFRRACGK